MTKPTNKIPTVQVGEKLKNGGVVLASVERFGERGESFAVGVVLCLLPESGSASNFVTWRYSVEVNTYWGSYHDKIESAVKDYSEREKDLGIKGLTVRQLVESLKELPNQDAKVFFEAEDVEVPITEVEVSNLPWATGYMVK